MKSNAATYTGFEFEVDGHPALAIINTDLKNVAGNASYTNSVFIEIIPETFNNDGHPGEMEYDFLIEVEKTMIEYLEEQTTTVHVGHTTVYRKREIIFYTKDAEVVETYLEHYLSGIGREYTIDIESDPEWENVAGFYELI